MSVLESYGIGCGHIPGRIGAHIVDDFMEDMEKSGYVSKKEGTECG